MTIVNTGPGSTGLVQSGTAAAMPTRCYIGYCQEELSDDAL